MFRYSGIFLSLCSLAALSRLIVTAGCAQLAAALLWAAAEVWLPLVSADCDYWLTFCEVLLEWSVGVADLTFVPSRLQLVVEFNALLHRLRITWIFGLSLFGCSSWTLPRGLRVLSVACDVSHAATLAANAVSWIGTAQLQEENNQVEDM